MSHICDMKNKLVLFSIMFLALFLCQSVFSYVSKASNELSKIVPRIDDEAASIVREDKAEKSVSTKILLGEENIYSQNFWMFLFGAYVFLMIFNLSFDFEKQRKIQWFLEAFLTFLAIFVWDQLDFERVNSWFPAVILESGIIIYGFYLYFMRKRLSLNLENKPN